MILEGTRLRLAADDAVSRDHPIAKRGVRFWSRVDIISGNSPKDNDPIKKCFDSRSNLVDHLKYLVDLELMERKTINGKNHYRFNNRNAHQLINAYNYAWFRELPDKVSSELLGRMRNDLESKYREELKESGALFLRYRI